MSHRGLEENNFKFALPCYLVHSVMYYPCLPNAWELVNGLRFPSVQRLTFQTPVSDARTLTIIRTWMLRLCLSFRQSLPKSTLLGPWENWERIKQEEVRAISF